jgi:hypothetical protein
MSTAELAEAEQAVRDLQFAREADPHPPRPARPPRPPRRSPRHPARGPPPRGRDHAHRTQGAPHPPSRSCGALRYLGLDVGLFADALAVSARDQPRHAREWGHVHAFTFGTSLTNVTRALRQADPDLALAAAGQEARDWEGGTRIGASLERFNKAWSRRVLTSGATVILITDGLERDDLGLLDREAARLSRSVGRLVWLNPLLRWDGFSPRRAGCARSCPMWTASTPAIRSTAFRRCPRRWARWDFATACWPRRGRLDRQFARAIGIV